METQIHNPSGSSLAVVSWALLSPSTISFSVIYRNSYLLSSSELWYEVTHAEYEQLESVGKMWMKNPLVCSSGIPAELVNLVLGLWPSIHIVMKSRRLYLHHILQQSENYLLLGFFLS